MIDNSLGHQLSSVLSLVDKEVIEFKNFIEFLALFSGKKEIVRLVIKHSQYPDIEKFVQTWLSDYFFAEAPFLIETVSWVTPHDRLTQRKPKTKSSIGDHVVFIGKEKAVQLALGSESSTCDDNETANIYGYPTCCGEKYSFHMESEWWPDSFVEECASYEKLNFLNNRFSMHQLPMLTYQFDYFPCSPKCKKTEIISRNNRVDLQTSSLAELLPMVDQHMKAIVVFFKQSFWYIRSSEIENCVYSGTPLESRISHEKHKKSSYLESLVLKEEDTKVTINGKEYLTRDKEVRVLVFD